jgi:hypothetical protein
VGAARSVRLLDVVEDRMPSQMDLKTQIPRCGINSIILGAVAAAT